MALLERVRTSWTAPAPPSPRGRPAQPALRDPDPGLVGDLGRILAPDRVLSRPLDRLGRSVDASLYRLVPQVVVRPRTLEEVRALFAYARARRRRLTFRTAGTSLSGQALTDDVLVELAPFWKRVEVLDGGRRVRSQPGVVGSYVNRLLAPLGYRLGPDPASIDAAMVGGIVANNSSGMCCGVVLNSYHTLDALRFVLADGTVVDTARPDADEALARACPDVHIGLRALRDEVRADTALAARIRRKFARKNTTGYSLNAFLDFDRPADILAHLMVGSEGTLGFLAEVTLRTVPEPPARGTGLLFFADLAEAGAAVAPLAAAGAAALEIMDSASLRSQAGERAYPFPIGERTAALLAEFREADAAALEAALRRARAALASFPLLAPAAFSVDPAAREEHWRLRKGLYPSVGALRPRGTAVLMEDIVVPVERLAEAIVDLQALFARHRLHDAIIFGHARDGNLHFVLAMDFSSPEAVKTFDALLRDAARLVIDRYDGALKGEHGSGRNMAPFVRDEWGDAAYRVMQRVKALLDPDGILNPGVLLSDDPDLHVKDLKPLPEISPLADRCIECGFCEPRCPSRDLTLSPRQRIVIAREMARLSARGEHALVEALRRDFAYEGIETCARDGMCQTACPVKIDTGALVKEIERAGRGRFAHRLAGVAARRFSWTARLARTGLATAARMRALPGGPALVEQATAVLHRWLPSLVPRLPRDLVLPRAAARLPRLDGMGGRRVVYFPSCLTRVVGPLPGEGDMDLPAAMRDVLGVAGFAAVYPEGVDALCCGMAFGSKGCTAAAAAAGRAALESLARASDNGRDPIVTDASPCAATLRDSVARAAREGGPSLRVLDFPSFWATEALPSMADPPRRAGTAVLHPTCSLLRAGGLPDLLRVARAHAERVVVPAGAECCGFAGDRGFLVPELTAAATVREAGEVRDLVGAGEAGLFSTCRTCEIGMARAVGRPYRSLVHLVREALVGEEAARD